MGWIRLFYMVARMMSSYPGLYSMGSQANSLGFFFELSCINLWLSKVAILLSIATKSKNVCINRPLESVVVTILTSK